MSEQALGNKPAIDHVKPEYRPSRANLETGPVDYFSYCKRVRTEVGDAPSPDGSRRGGRRLTALAARWQIAAALLLVGLAALVATPAQADTVTLVSNFGSVSTSASRSGPERLLHLHPGAEVHDGSEHGRIHPGDVEVQVGTYDGTNITPRVSIYSEGNDGNPGSSLYVLTGDDHQHRRQDLHGSRRCHAGREHHLFRLLRRHGFERDSPQLQREASYVGIHSWTPGRNPDGRWATPPEAKRRELDDSSTAKLA